ncbi:MAG: universal stress protein, partial [Chloroflexota bacterium]|nr:universal stress protein [Chloroflexota bacterium]
MPRRLLVPVDGSQASQAALATIEVMGDRPDLEVVLVAMVQPTEDVFGCDHVQRSQALLLTRCIETNVGKYLARVEARLRAQGIATRPMVLFGAPSQELWELARREDAEMLVPHRGPRGPQCSRPRPEWCDS